MRIVERLLGDLWIIAVALFCLGYGLYHLFFRYRGFIKIEQRNGGRYRIYEHNFVYWKLQTSEDFSTAKEAVDYVAELLRQRNESLAKVILQEITTKECQAKP